jgi:hypothetical protein
MRLLSPQRKHCLLAKETDSQKVVSGKVLEETITYSTDRALAY